ncbi:MAG: baeRF11 domain-containing protein [Wenzhouxiangella sp.]
MLHVDIPTLPEIQTLVAQRNPASVSIYLETTPQTQHIGEAGIVLSNLIKQADEQLEAAGIDKRTRWAIVEQLEDVSEDEDFWKYQANSLAIFATPDSHRSYRLPNRLGNLVQVADRFHLKPLIRSVSVEQHAFVLALAENEVRVIEVFSDMPAAEIKVPNLPKDAASAVGTGTVNTRSHSSGRLHGSEGQKVHLRKFCRMIDAALRPMLAGRHEPLILAAAEPLLSIYRSVNTYPEFAEQVIGTSPVRVPAHELAEQARPILDKRHADSIEAFKALYRQRENEGRATSDIAMAARAATFGAIDTLVVDIDEVVFGTVDEETGAVTFADHDGADTYGVVDEIAGRTLAMGGRVIGERKEDIPGDGSLAAVLRYKI